jgi:hypothetical protein
MGTLYDLLPELPRPNASNTSTTLVALHAADGVIGTAQAQSHSVSSTNPKSSSSNVQNAPSPATPIGKNSEVNAVQSTPAGKNKSKKGRGKNKEGKNNNQTEQPKTTPVEDRDKHKPRYSLSVVMIITRRIVHDVPRSLSSFKEHQNHLHRLSCPNPSRLNNRLSWSFTTNPPLLRHHMF